MSKVYNFCAGPAMLPDAVMEQAQQEFVNWQGRGCSIMELSHRSEDFMAVASQAESDLRELMAIPEHYEVLFMHGGGRGQFSAVPLNLAGDGDSADFVISGAWSQSAVAEAKKYLHPRVITENQTQQNSTSVLPVNSWDISPDAKYLHYCPNETVDGIAIHEVPDSGEVPLVADMSSMILSKAVDVERFGLIYAGAQKNIGPSGLSIAIVRSDLLERARPQTPSVFHYKTLAEHGSMYNTPPTYAWYLAGLVFKWLKRQGGIEAIARINEEKATLLYHCIDNSDFYINNIAHSNRSLMNVPFQLADPQLDALFLKHAAEAGLTALKGHRSVGGMRASIYNAMPLAGVQTLVAFMMEFERRFG